MQDEAKINERLKGTPGLAILMAIARDRRHDGIDDDHRGQACRADSGPQGRYVFCRIEGALLFSRFDHVFNKEDVAIHMPRQRR